MDQNENEKREGAKSAELQAKQADAAALHAAANNLHLLKSFCALGELEFEYFEAAENEIKAAFVNKREPDLRFLRAPIWGELYPQTGPFAWMFSDDPPVLSVEFIASIQKFKLSYSCYWRHGSRVESYMSRTDLLKVAYYLLDSHVDQVYLRGADIHALYLNGAIQPITSCKMLRLLVIASP